MIDIISPDTNFDLHRVAAKYTETVSIPYFAHVGQFAAAYAGMEISSVETLVTGSADSLAISIECGEQRDFLNVDIPHEGPATIVRPGADTSGNMIRTPLRALTEAEGRALVADIRRINCEVPEDRQKR